MKENMLLDTTTKTTSILIVENPADQNTSILAQLRGSDYRLMRTDSMESVVSVLENEEVEMLICNLSNFDENSWSTLDRAKRKHPLVDFIIISENSIEWDKNSRLNEEGEFLSSPISTNQLLATIKRIARHQNVRMELLNLRGRMAMSYGFDNIIGISKPISDLKETVNKISPTDINVYLIGESGTGKKQLAHTIHYHSKRRMNSFVMVDCSIIPEYLHENEIFGTYSVANQLANSNRLNLTSSNINSPFQQSALEKANGGTLFINEIHRLTLPCQGKLIKFLQTFEITGSTHQTSFKADIRVIASTGTDIESLVEQGLFLKELHYLCNVFPIEMPTLSECSEDIELLVDYFLRRISFEMQTGSVTISRRAMEKLHNYNWPGNVRELENTLQRSAALCRENLIEAEDIRFISSSFTKPKRLKANNETKTISKTSLADNQKTIIKKVLEENQWNFTQSAQELGIGRTTLWRKVKKYQLKRPPETTEE